MKYRMVRAVMELISAVEGAGYELVRVEFDWLKHEDVTAVEFMKKERAKE